MAMQGQRKVIKLAKCQDIRKQNYIYFEGWFRCNWGHWNPAQIAVDKVKRIITISHNGVQFTISMNSMDCAQFKANS
jgi:hypothetical protein